MEQIDFQKTMSAYLIEIIKKLSTVVCYKTYTYECNYIFVGYNDKGIDVVRLYDDTAKVVELIVNYMRIPLKEENQR